MIKLGQSWKILVSMFLLSVMTGCIMIGPDFKDPEAPIATNWQTKGVTLSEDALAQVQWWKLFDDPVLNTLIDTAYQQNLPLQVAGLRIVEARAQLGIAVGQFFPQQQSVGGSLTKEKLSENRPFGEAADRNYGMGQIGFDAAWELDFWGRFRRGIESAEANLGANVAEYDNALISLTSEVARVYVAIRTLEERLVLARKNVALQEESLRIATVRFENGATSELDMQQATYNLAETQALVPSLVRSLRQAKNGLSVLLGMPPADLTNMLGGSGSIPDVPVTIAAGIPSDLLRRRPDVRQAEYLAATQSALIGVAKAELFPSFSLTGSIGFQTSNFASSHFGNLLDTESLFLSVGPTFRWNILNYGRIRNNIRVQDARLQQSLVDYRNTVLVAYREVEDAMVAFVQLQLESNFRDISAKGASRAVEISSIQYMEGSIDFLRVVDAQRVLVVQQDKWVSTRGDIVLNLIAMYKALGGGWEIREGNDFISAENRIEMEERTNWGDLLTPPSESN